METCSISIFDEDKSDNGKSERYYNYHRSRAHSTQEGWYYTRELCRVAEAFLLTRRSPPAPSRWSHGSDRWDDHRRDSSLKRRSPKPVQHRHGAHLEDGKENPPSRGDINMILGGSTNWDSNKARKTHGWRLESYGIGTRTQPKVGLPINIDSRDLEGMTTHKEALVI